MDSMDPPLCAQYRVDPAGLCIPSTLHLDNIVIVDQAIPRERLGPGVTEAWPADALRLARPDMQKRQTDRQTD